MDRETNTNLPPTDTPNDCAKSWSTVDKIEHVAIRAAEFSGALGATAAISGAASGAIVGASAAGVGALPGAAVVGIMGGAVGLGGGLLIGAEAGLFEALHHNVEADNCRTGQDWSRIHEEDWRRDHEGRSRAELKKMEMGAPPTPSVTKSAHITPPATAKSKPPLP